MRAWIGVFSLSAIGSTGFAVNELRQLEHHTPMVVRPLQAAREVPVAVVQERPELSSWRGAVPFGGVRTEDAVKVDENDEEEADLADDENDDDDDGEGVPDEEDRCPDDNGDQDNDGCPEIINGPEDGRTTIKYPAKIVVTVDGNRQRIILLERSEIIIY